MCALVLIKFLGLAEEVIEGAESVGSRGVAHGLFCMTISKFISDLSQVQKCQFSGVRTVRNDKVDNVVLIQVVNIVFAGLNGGLGCRVGRHSADDNFAFLFQVVELRVGRVV